MFFFFLKMKKTKKPQQIFNGFADYIKAELKPPKSNWGSYTFIIFFPPPTQSYRSLHPYVDITQLVIESIQ